MRRVSEQVNRENKEADVKREESYSGGCLGTPTETVLLALRLAGAAWTSSTRNHGTGEIGDPTAYAHKEDLKAQMLLTYPENGTQKNDIHAPGFERDEAG